MRLEKDIVVIHGGFFIGFSKENFRVYNELLLYYNLDKLNVIMFTWNVKSNLDYVDKIKEEFKKYPRLTLHVIVESYDTEFLKFCQKVQSTFSKNTFNISTDLTRRIVKWYIISKLANFVSNNFKDSYTLWINYKNFEFKNFNFVKNFHKIKNKEIGVHWAKLNERGVKDTFFFTKNENLTEVFPPEVDKLALNVSNSFAEAFNFYNIPTEEFNKFLRYSDESFSTSYNPEGKVFWKGPEIFYFMLEPYFTPTNFIQLGVEVRETHYPLPRIEFVNGELTLHDIKPIPGKFPVNSIL